MPNLTRNGNFIISENQTPTQTEINNQYAASSIKLTFNSVKSDNSGMTDDGTEHIFYIVKNKRKLEIEMPPMRLDTQGNALSTLLSSIQGRTYWITYYDIITKGEKTIHVYTDNSESNCYSGVINGGVWTGVAFVATEIRGEV